MAPTALLGVSTLCLCAATADGQLLGRIQWRPSDAIISSKWSIGTETMDRNLTVYDRYSAYLPPLGAKRARLQCGWGRCDHGPGAPYNWGWLDEAVFGLAAMGIKPWLELSYGNSNYPGGGTNGPGAAVPDSTVALEAWAAWVAAVAHRYSNVTDEFELWNEPSLGPSNYLPYATLANVTCRALHQVREKAATPGWAPQIFYGTMSGGYSGAGPEFLDGTLPLLEQQLAGSGLSLQDCIASVTYHAYSVHPEDTAQIRSGGVRVSRRMRRALDVGARGCHGAPRLQLDGGEAGEVEPAQYDGRCCDALGEVQLRVQCHRCVLRCGAGEHRKLWSAGGELPGHRGGYVH
jgi:hypothetical protein